MKGWVALALVGCSGGGSADLVFEQANNFEYKGVVTLESIDVESHADFCADWSAVTVDLRGRAFDPAKVEQIYLLELDLTQDEVEAKIAANTLVQADAATQWIGELDNPTDTEICASAFEIIGNVLDTGPDGPLDENADQTWLMSLVDIVDGVTDVLTSVFVVPTDGSTNHDVLFTDTSSQLDVQTLDIAGKPAIETQADIGPYTLDWSAVTTDVNGQTFDPLLGDRLLVAHYDADDASAVEGQFLTLDESAAEKWTWDVFGKTDADLSLPDLNGASFDGFTADGVWLVAISCSTCTSPVPLLLSVVSVN